MNRESLKRHCEAMCKKFKDVPTSGAYREHRLVLDLLEQTEWIPISEKLPEKEGLYLVSVKNDHERRYSKTCWFHGNGNWFARQDVIAWMPLPEPFEP